MKSHVELSLPGTVALTYMTSDGRKPVLSGRVDQSGRLHALYTHFLGPSTLCMVSGESDYAKTDAASNHVSAIGPSIRRPFFFVRRRMRAWHARVGASPGCACHAAVWHRDAAAHGPRDCGLERAAPPEPDVVDWHGNVLHGQRKERRM
jgi:hypothetical protein